MDFAVRFYDLDTVQSPFPAFPEVLLTIDGPSSGMVVVGEDVLLTCCALPGVGVAWSRQDGKPLPATSEGNLLHIPNPQLVDSGVYICEVGHVTASFSLQVVEPTTLSEEMWLLTFRNV